MFHSAAPLPVLRARLAQLERGPPRAREQRVLPLGAPAIDTLLPAGGLALGALHDIAGGAPGIEHEAAATLFAAGLLARLPGPVLWVLRRADLFAPGLATVGLDPDRLLLVEAERETLATMEEGLRHAGLIAVVGEVTGTLSLTQSRRLHLAAEQGGGLGLLLRRGAEATASAPTAAFTSWRVTTLPAPPALPHAPGTPDVGRARWRLDLIRCRGGTKGGGGWIVEACDATGYLALVAQPADGSVAADWRRSA